MNAPLPRVIIVDDESRMRSLLVQYLEDYEEFRLETADSGETALKLLAAEPADLCIVDIRLPGMDGAAFIREARKRGRCDRFLVHTGSLDLNLSEQLNIHGLCDEDVFYKPTDLDALLARLRFHLHTAGS